MLVSLTNNEDRDGSTSSVGVVGGKAYSLAKLFQVPGLSSQCVPRAYALTVDFFRPWIEAIRATSEWAELEQSVTPSVCKCIKEMCPKLPLSVDQEGALEKLRQEMKSWSLAAVRSSAPEEDGDGASFAGAFETKLGVVPKDLEGAVRACFASVFDHRVFSYIQQTRGAHGNIAFAAVVMEMVDSRIAGVAFSANPLNSDRDEMVVDSSWGLGESVVDGSIEADRYIYDKVHGQLVDKTIGKKSQEKRLVVTSDGGVETRPVEDRRQRKSSLSGEQLDELAKLVCSVELAYKMPMDIEWAYTISGELKCLQARPITTLFNLDENMMTLPGEPRVLYYDFNIASEATTTTPFTYMDLVLYSDMCSIMLGAPNLNMFPQDPRMILFNASTRQYANMSIFFKFITPRKSAKFAQTLDHYLASIFASKDCNRKKYRIKKLPKEINLRNAWWIVRQLPLRRFYSLQRKYACNPEKAKEYYLSILEQDMCKLQKLESRGMNEADGLEKYANEMIEAILPSIFEELGCIMVILPIFQELDKKRRESKTKEKCDEYEALCGGYVGDPLMEENIEFYRLARKLPEEIWSEYNHSELHKLAERIKSSIDGNATDLPSDFLEEWNKFMDYQSEKYFGFDGQDQLFISCPRYIDSPELLLAKLSHNVGATIKDPATYQQEQLARRRKVMALHESRAQQCWRLRALSKIKKRNAILDHLMWIRNSPKMHFARVFGSIRGAVLKVQDELIDRRQLEEKGDIFYLSLKEVDNARQDPSYDVMTIINPRKAAHQMAIKAKECPLLVDSRCRILKPDPSMGQGDLEGDVLLGAAISPGVAKGRVRIIQDPSEQFEAGEVLATVVTGPAWTPMFIGASAIILQIGGVLQHGALCAREYGKPAVSNIDVLTVLKTGMLVSVDGNTGIVQILEKGEDVVC